jgi:Flp pilus assembly protein TadG
VTADIKFRQERDQGIKPPLDPRYLPFPRRSGLRAGYLEWLRRSRSEYGSTLVETALSLVILLTVAMGVMEMSLALYTYHFISDAAREGTRFAIVRGSSCAANAGLTSACPATQADIQSYVQGLGYPGIDPNLMTVTTTAYLAYPTGTVCTAAFLTCMSPGNQVKVIVSYQFPLSIPFIPASTLTMSSTSQMVIAD